MNTFYIARHGETKNNKSRRLSKCIDTPLTQDGLVPTHAVIDKLANVPFDAIYSSDLGRAFITAYTIAKGLNFTDEIQRLAGLREVNYGVAANMPSAIAYEQFPLLDRNTEYTPPEGESLEHMQQRVLQTVAELDAQHSNETILLVCHSGVMAALKASHIGQDFGEHNISEAYPHEYVGVFTYADGAIDNFEEFK